MNSKIFILDDHTAIIKGLESQINAEVYTVYSSIRYCDLIAKIKEETLDLLILDYELMEGTAFDLIPQIRKHQSNLPIIIYTMHDEPWIISMLVKLNVNGIVIKGDRIEEIEKAMKSILEHNEKYFSASALKTVLTILGDNTTKNNLIYSPSPREIDIINLLSKGHTSEDIANDLHLSKNTIDTMRKNILLKSGAINVSHLMRMAFLKGWIKS